MSTNTNKESKSILAKLLAAEGISVFHDPKAETAMFDVRNRNLVLPVWKDMTDDIYDMLVGHEVGHALFTPYDRIKEDATVSAGPWCADAQIIGGDSHGHIAMSYLNIVEDARIEKMMKIKFPGLRRDFVSAYNKLDARDFFGAHAKKPRFLIDRINLHFKMGVAAETTLNISFSPKEQVFVDRITNANTYDEVVQIVKDIWDYEIENSKNPPQSMPEYVPSEGDGGGGERNEGESKESTEGSSGISGGKGGKHTSGPSMPETHNKYLESCKDLVNKDVKQSKYRIMPTAKLKNIIITTDEINHMMDSYSSSFGKSNKSSELAVQQFRENAVLQTKKFIRESNKSVAVLVKQFEMRKAADAHKRTLTAKTGILDTIKMVKYKFDDDVFARHLTIRAGKNHGIVMFIDWSSSMTNIIDDTVKQCFLIALFCKKCNIPFDVYAFSSVNIRAEINKHALDYPNADWNSNLCEDDLKYANSWTADGQDLQTVLQADRENDDDDVVEKHYMHFDNFSLLHFVSSKMPMKEMTDAMANMFQITASYGRSSRESYYMVNPVLRLSGTPLNECIVAATDIVNLFRETYNLQVVSTIMLTDGEGGGGNFYRGTDKDNEHSYCIHEKKKITYDISKILVKEDTTSRGRYCSVDTKILLRIHALETGSNVLGFYLNDSSTISQSALQSFTAEERPVYVYPTYGPKNHPAEALLHEQCIIETVAYDKRTSILSAQYKKEGYFVASPHSRLGGYKELYVIRGSSMTTDTTEGELNDLDELCGGSTVTKVRSAFRKQMKDSSVSKNLLNRIIDNICI